MIHSAETQKLLEALVAFVPEDQRQAFGDAAHKFLDSLTIDYEAEFTDEAGEKEIRAFSDAAIALAPLNVEMRDRVLRSLRALMLERGPTALDRFLEGMLPLLPELFRHLNHPAHKEGGETVGAPETGHDGGQVECAGSKAVLWLKDGEALVQLDDGTLWIHHKDSSPSTQVQLTPTEAK